MKAVNAIVFPAFVTEFLGCETSELQDLGLDIKPYLEQAAVICGNEITNFDLSEHSFLRDEAMIQYVTYIYSCAVSDLLHKRGVQSNHIAGYSMGIYAALYHAKSISFMRGLDLIQSAFFIMKESLPKGAFSMGLTGGLEIEDVKKILAQCGPSTHIINSNNPHTFVYSGPLSEIEAILTLAKEEGALMTRLMNVTIPYHSPYLNMASEIFSGFLETIDFEKPELPVTSSLSLKKITSAEEVRMELSDNLHSPFRWYDTMKLFLSEGVNHVFECGAGEGLTKINKFITLFHQMAI